jgi:hypothetical protein
MKSNLESIKEEVLSKKQDWDPTVNKNPTILTTLIRQKQKHKQQQSKKESSPN